MAIYIIYQEKFYCDDRFNFPPGTKVMDSRRVVEISNRAGCGNPQAKSIEHSTGNSDHRRLSKCLEQNGGLGHVLGGHGSLGLLPPMQWSMPGVWWCSLDDIFAHTRPEPALATQAHRAMIDAQKPRIVFPDLIADCGV